MNEDPLAISVPTAADLLGVSARTVKRMVARGELPTVRIGGRVMIPTRRLAEWVEKNTKQAS